MFISKKKYMKELNDAWIDGHNMGVHEGERKGRREQITTTDIQNYLGRYLISNRHRNDNLLTRHSCWVTRTKIYDSNPTTIYVWKECPECGKMTNHTMFKTEDWSNYHKERWNPTRLPNFCEDCGSKMDEAGGVRFTDTVASINALAKLCRTGEFNYYIAVEDHDGTIHEVYKFAEGSKTEKNFKKMKGIKEREDERNLI